MQKVSKITSKRNFRLSVKDVYNSQIFIQKVRYKNMEKGRNCSNKANICGSF